MAPRVWFLTGCSSGLGLEAVKQIAESDDEDIAIATLRDPSNAPELKELASSFPERVSVMQLDVSKSDEIRETLRKAVEKFGRIDVVFNNAGYFIGGEVEGISLDQAKALFDVNFWGIVAVSQEAVRIFRDVNPKTGTIGGILFQASSMNGGSKSLPNGTFYAASKAAVSSFSEALQGELDPEWHIAVSSIQYGFFHTKGFQKSVTVPVHPAYGSHFLGRQILDYFSSGSPIPGGDASDAIKTLLMLSKRKVEDIPKVLNLGKDAVQFARENIVDREKAAKIGEELSKDYVTITK